MFGGIVEITQNEPRIRIRTGRDWILQLGEGAQAGAADAVGATRGRYVLQAFSSENSLD